MLSEIIKKTIKPPTFTILDVGADPLGGPSDPYYSIIDTYPGSNLVAFEVDPDLCRTQNEKAKKGIKFYPVALGRADEERPFYITNHSMCCSLYKPNDDFLKLFNNMEVSLLKETTTIKTTSLDHFVKDNKIGKVDFIKMDIQGAELDVFSGGVSTLKNVLAIICEVEFVPLYIDQPLFGDVCKMLSEQGFIFSKFLGFGGRTFKPVTMNKNINFAGHFLWSDAVFYRHPSTLKSLSPEQLLKLAVITDMYGSGDFAYQCLHEIDSIKGTNLAQTYILSKA